MVNLKESKEVLPLPLSLPLVLLALAILEPASLLPPAAGEGPADLPSRHVQPEHGDPQRPRPGAAGRLQAHVLHGGAHHRLPEPAADAGSRCAAVEGRPQPALKHKGEGGACS